MGEFDQQQGYNESQQNHEQDRIMSKRVKKMLTMSVGKATSTTTITTTTTITSQT